MCQSFRVHNIHCKKRLAVFPSPAGGCHFPNSPWPAIIKLFPARESLVSDIPELFPARESLVRDIPVGDGKTANLFLQCRDEKYGNGPYIAT